MKAPPYVLSDTLRILVCAGGTGGGIYPALAVVSELQKRGLDRDQVLWIGTRGEMEEQLVPRSGLRLETIRGGAVVGVPLRTALPNTGRLAWSVATATRLIRRFRPAIMFMTGGYMAAPVAVAATLQRIPIGIYLPDVEPGATIRFAMPLARRIACTTDGSAAFVPAQKIDVTGYPVRPEVRAANQLTKREALAAFDLAPRRQTLFVFGGSRGAQAINRALMNTLPDIVDRYQVIHISGHLTWSEVEANYRAADLVVARAGASMLGEGPAFGLPAILVPLTFAWRYQKVNADYLTERGAAVQLTDETLHDRLWPTVRELLDDSARLAEMGRSARLLDKPQATAHLADFIVALAKDGSA
jgi:UDP-N-acetylglucosamine:LPS N-acetylglucosamine transferase